jgi:hypothetical protein
MSVRSDHEEAVSDSLPRLSLRDAEEVEHGRMRHVGGDAVAVLIHGPLVLRQVRVARADVPLLQMLQLVLQVEPISLSRQRRNKQQGQ